MRIPPIVRYRYSIDAFHLSLTFSSYSWTMHFTSTVLPCGEYIFCLKPYPNFLLVFWWHVLLVLNRSWIICDFNCICRMHRVNSSLKWRNKLKLALLIHGLLWQFNTSRPVISNHSKVFDDFSLITNDTENIEWNLVPNTRNDASVQFLNPNFV